MGLADVSRIRILLTADPDLPVPPSLYGGVERVVALLAGGLAARGHDVVLCAHRDSRPSCSLVPYAASSRSSAATTLRNAATVRRAYARLRPSVVHSFSRLAYLAPLLPLKVPKIMSYQRRVTPSRIKWATALSRGTLHGVACSASMLEGVRHLTAWHVIANAVDLDAYRPTERVPADAPLAFVGRIEHIKGTHLAIEAARRSGRRLVIGGNVAPEHREYFDREVGPFVDGDRVTYIGEIDDARKSALLSAAAAFLMPIQWEEPFGIVMAEALAAGTPVIGLRRGAVPEVVEDGDTGFICDTIDDMVRAIGRVDEISRRRCRLSAERRFSESALVTAYEHLYRRVLQVEGAALQESAA